MSLTELSVSFRGIGLRVDQLPQGHPIWERYDDYLGCPVDPRNEMPR